MIGRNILLSYVHVPIMVKRCHPNAKLPTQKPGDVGFDISCVEDVVIPPQSTKLIHVGLQLAETIEPQIVENKIIAMPYLKVEGRSGLALKGIFPVGGVIDPSYRGEIGCILFNSTQSEVRFPVGSRVAQLVCYYVLSNSEQVKVTFVETDNSTQTDRGSKGFGSSGR